jgi:putative ABC transport system substrate-binding protein
MIRRREFITLLGGATAAWPVAALAQQPGMPVVGYLHLGSPEPQAHVVAGFRKGLSEAGYVEGRNVAIEFRFGYDQFDRLTEMVADLVRRRVAVIAVPAGGTTALAAKAATTSIPIVFGTAVDPVQIGLVASLNRPGGNVTGISNMSVEITAKRLGLLHELLPNAARFAVLVNAQTGTPPTTAMIADVQAAASTIGSRIEVLTATDSREIDSAFGSLAQKRIDALIVTNSNLFVSRRTQFVTLAAHHRVPVMSYMREYPAAGGLMSYGASFSEQGRLVGLYTARILKGEKPADLPLMQPTKFELVINLQTARTLGIEVPPTLLAIADEVIESRTHETPPVHHPSRRCGGGVAACGEGAAAGQAAHHRLPRREHARGSEPMDRSFRAATPRARLE